jgi:7 transmembrane receptor (rhodopsin family)
MTYCINSQVQAMVATTWVVPAAVFFTSIIGWQYFVGNRSVPHDKCYVQYMENSVFNFLLQVGYFWATMAVMCALYAGIYRVALRLHHKSRARRQGGLPPQLQTPKQQQQQQQKHRANNHGLLVTSSQQVPPSPTVPLLDHYGSANNAGDDLGYRIHRLVLWPLIWKIACLSK